MREYILFFRMDIITPENQPGPEQMESYMQDWMKWLNSISQRGQLADGGNHLSVKSSKVIRSNNERYDGPYVANNESVAGYIIILAKDLEDAALIAEKCPILNGSGNSVEIRETATPHEV